MESSGPYDEEDIDHSMGDTAKIITMTTNSLRQQLLQYQNASFEAAKGLSVFSVQCICDKITLMKTSLCATNMCHVVESNRATIPVTWDTRVNMMAKLAILQASTSKYNSIGTHSQRDILEKIATTNCW